MADPELVSVKWLYYLGTAIVALCGTIVAMAKWFAKERTKVAKQYKALMIALNKELNRVGDYLREIYKRELKADIDVTAFDFTIDNGDTLDDEGD